MMMQTITHLENIKEMEKLKNASYEFGAQPIVETFSRMLEDAMEEENDEGSGFLPMFVPVLISECIGKNSVASAGEAIYRELQRKLSNGGGHHG
jgi:hypothetical protein